MKFTAGSFAPENVIYRQVKYRGRVRAAAVNFPGSHRQTVTPARRDADNVPHSSHDAT